MRHALRCCSYRWEIRKGRFPSARPLKRFLAFEKTFLDPATLSDQPQVTIVGEVTGLATASLDETEYRYPTIAIKHMHVWDTQAQDQQQGFGVGLGIGGGGGVFGGGIGIGTGF